MSVRRLIPALLVALSVSGLCTYMLGKGVSAHVATTTQRYVAAAKSMEAGEVLKPESMQLVEWPASVPLQGAFATPGDINGRLVLYPMAAGQPILERDLAKKTATKSQAHLFETVIGNKRVVNSF